MVAAEGDTVYIHGRYFGLGAVLGGGDIHIAVDIFRVEDGLIAEHWDVLQPEVPPEDTVSGNPMFVRVPGALDA